MRISQLRKWLEVQESLYGDAQVLCRTSSGNVVEDHILRPDLLGITTAERMYLKDLQPETKIIAIGLEHHEL
jgi:hypothetical protein